ncbi:MAG: glycosyltransferase [Deltaproteobacteria bacterium]|nr:glycosyltransferase [Deltaproteobacteria bacterium]MBI3387709.1 glycosyltransferase [Deltaproteobacteria bacterium]
MERESTNFATRARPLRLTLVGPTPPLRGGIAHYTTALVRALRPHHQVQVVGLRRQYPKWFFPGTTEVDRSAVPLAMDADVVVDPLLPTSWPAAARAIAAHQPDAIVMAWWQPALGAVLASFVRYAQRRCSTRVIFLCHNVGAHDATPLDRWLTRYGLRTCDAVIAHSDSDARQVARVHPRARVVRTTHPAYDLPEFGAALDSASARAQLGLAGDVLLFFGLIRRYKGLTDVIAALPRIRQHRDCTLLVAGEFYEPRAHYDAQIEALGLSEHVRLCDAYVPNEQVGVYFSAADMILAPYRRATQSSVVAVAQQFQRPVIVSRVGGLRDMIEEGVTGLSVPPTDPDALATAVLRIYDEGLDTWRARVQQARVTTWAEERDAIERLAAP